MKNTAHVDFNEKNLDNVRFVKVSSMPAVREHLTPWYFVDQAIPYHVNEPSLLRLLPDEKLWLDELDSINLNSTLTSPETIIELPTKSNVDSFHGSRRNGRDLSSVFNDQDNEFDNNKVTKLYSVTVNRNPNLDNKLSNKKHVDDSKGQATTVRFNQSLRNYLKVSFGNDTYNLTKNGKIQVTDTTFINYLNTGGDLLQNWVSKCNDKKNNGKRQNFNKSLKTNSWTGYLRATSLPPTGKSFIYIETASNTHDNFVFVSLEGIDIFQISNITF